MVSSLFQIAQSVCIKQAAHILDIGDTPYHLVQPILKRLNAKQLAQLEENSPIVIPHSDELWGSLVERDFPDRPCSASKSRFSALAENTHMPLRALYKKYAMERDHFRATSADRLRRMTDQLRREKLKNSITTVHEVLADPTIRRRQTQYPGTRSSTQKQRPTSILGKARRDVLQRLLMFGGPIKCYDPYKPFQNGPDREQRLFSPKNKAVIRSPTKPAATVNSRDFESPPPINSSVETSKPALALETAPLRKRKPAPAPSIFLNTRKKPRRVPIKSPAAPGTTRPNPETRSGPNQIKAIKSSIFH